MITELTDPQGKLYRLLIQGYLDKSWSDRLEGLTINSTDVGNEPGITILEGRLDDEEALSGVLSALHDLGYSLLSVDCLSG
jgi:hypothetical protein